MDTVPANSTRTLDCCEPLGGNYKMRKSILARTGFGLDRVMILDAFPYFCVVFVQKAQHTQVISVCHLISGQTLSREKIIPSPDELSGILATKEYLGSPPTL